MAVASLLSKIATPVPFIPCHRPSIFTPSGGAPPVSRNFLIAVSIKFGWNLQLEMYFIEISNSEKPYTWPCGRLPKHGRPILQRGQLAIGALNAR
jgi:hypothetical protein